MFVVSVETPNGKRYPLKYGAIVPRLTGEEAGALTLARMLSRFDTVETVYGRMEAAAVWVTSLDGEFVWGFSKGHAVE
jgi:hypothetical protein